MVTKYGMSERIGTLMLGSSQEEVFLEEILHKQKNTQKKQLEL